MFFLSTNLRLIHCTIFVIDRPDSKKTCQDLRCDPATTRMCIKGDDGPQCLCKDGFVAQNDGITCVGKVIQI